MIIPLFRLIERELSKSDEVEISAQKSHVENLSVIDLYFKRFYF